MGRLSDGRHGTLFNDVGVLFCRMYNSEVIHATEEVV